MPLDKPAETAPTNEQAAGRELLETVLDNGESLEYELALFKRRMRLQHDVPVFNMHVITDGLETYERLLDGIARFLGAARRLSGQSTGLDQYDELRQTLSSSGGLTVISDTKTRQIVPHPGWLHSQDQGYKGTSFTDELRRISSENGSRVVLVRFFDASDRKQLLDACAHNDFVDTTIKLTSRR